MAYDDDLADRVRAAIQDLDGVREKRMFGGLGFMVDDHLAVSASSRGGLMVRIDPSETERLLSQDGVSRFEMRGRAMNGWIHVATSALDSEEDLRRWVRVGTTYAGSLPPK